MSILDLLRGRPAGRFARAGYPGHQRNKKRPSTHHVWCGTSARRSNTRGTTRVASRTNARRRSPRDGGCTSIALPLVTVGAPAASTPSTCRGFGRQLGSDLRLARSVPDFHRLGLALRSLRDYSSPSSLLSVSAVASDSLGRPPPADQPCDLVFLDPPYGKSLVGPALIALKDAGWIDADTLVIVEVASKENFAAPDGFAAQDERVYGPAKFAFLRLNSK